MDPARPEEHGRVGEPPARDPRARLGDVAGVDRRGELDEPRVRGEHGPHDPEDARRAPREALEGARGVRDEAVLQQEVLGRVADHGELGHRDEVAPLLGAVGEGAEDPLHVAVEVPDGEVQLGEPEPDRRHDLEPNGATCGALLGFTRR